MNERLISHLIRIRENSDILMSSEAQTSQGIILPILRSLSWKDYDTSEVTPEFSVAGKRVDFALRIQSQNKVFLEIKKPSEDLEKHQEQLVYYAFQQGVKLAILTNGITWWFYLPLEEGGWEQRRFFTIDLNEQAVEDTAQKFENLLSREKIETSVAYQNAKSLYEGKQKNKIIRENLPKAWQKLISEPDEMLVELLNETLEKICGYKAEEFQIIEYLNQIQASPNSISKNKQVNAKSIAFPSTVHLENPNELIEINNESLSNLTFTKVIDGKFANFSSKSWRGLINTGLKIAVDRGIGIDVLKNELDANFKLGVFIKDGYKPVEGTGFSLQYQEANKVAKNLLKLAKLLNCELHILFQWQEKGKFPMKKGVIYWKP